MENFEDFNVLICDDDSESRNALAAALGFVGVRTLQADDGVAALKLVEAVQPTVVISDVDMPGLSGTHLATALRASYPARDCPYLVGMSGHWRPRDSRAPAPFDRFFPKPVAHADLIALVKALRATAHLTVF